MRASDSWNARALWWIDHLAASCLVSIWTPFVSFFGWPLVIPGGTVLRFVVERQEVRTRKGVLQRAWIMVAVGAAILVPMEAADEVGSIVRYAFGVVFLVVVPALLYALLMPLAGQRWFSLARFRRQPS